MDAMALWMVGKMLSRKSKHPTFPGLSHKEGYIALVYQSLPFKQLIGCFLMGFLLHATQVAIPT